MEKRISKLSSEEKAALVEAIGELSGVQSSLIILHYLRDQPLEAVAEKLELSDEEFTIQHHLALIALRRWMHLHDGF